MWDKGKVEREEEEEEEEEERVKGVQKTRLGLLVCIHEDVVKSLLEINAFNFNFYFSFCKKGEGKQNKQHPFVHSTFTVRSQNTIYSGNT